MITSPLLSNVRHRAIISQ